MKKGCFFTFITILTLVIMAFIYFVKHDKKKLIGLVKPFIIEKGQEDLRKKFDKVKNSPEKDSLNVLIHQFAGDVENEEFDLKKAEPFISTMTSSMEDNEIDSLELREITRLYHKQKFSK